MESYDMTHRQRYFLRTSLPIFKSYKVPKEDLLIWNVKDGWKPLCEFLQCPVPKIPIPHDNRTGDTKFAKGKSSITFKSKIDPESVQLDPALLEVFLNIQKEYWIKSDFMQRSLQSLQKYIILDLIKCGVIGYLAWKMYKTNGNWFTIF